MSTSATVQFSDVVRAFGRGGHTAVDGVSLLVDETSRVGVVGESGSGKSTLVRMLVGLDHPSAGTVEFNGRSIAAMLPDELRAFRLAVQLVAQDTTSSFDPRRTLRDAVRRPLEVLRGMDVAAADGAVDATLRGLGLDPQLANRLPHQVSGGQRQRFAIARALVVRPRLLVCDEAVSALDVSVQGAVLNLVKRYCREHGAGLVFVSHGLPATAFVADRLVVMHRGRVVEDGPREQVLFRPEHAYTRTLVDAHRRTGDRRGSVPA
ncbi:peptide ABC transporter ATP-binding protein [Pseudonocardia sp. CNS-139]|nr:peptide ABC transporter ATP-binding protein [Pseudonocardia sp. CNS-139]